MEEFINALMNIDNELQQEIIDRINKKEKLEEYHVFYIQEMRNLVERANKKRNKKIIDKILHKM